MRARYVRIKLPEKLMLKVADISEREVYGYRTMTEFVVEATRTRVREYELLERMPCDERKRSIPKRLIEKQGGA